MKDKFAALEQTEFRFGIPKCHCPAHKLECQPQHSLNLLPGLGRTDGEGIERGWSELNGVGNSTKEMGPGSRHDTIDDHLTHHNWRKSVLLGMYIFCFTYDMTSDPAALKVPCCGKDLSSPGSS